MKSPEVRVLPDPSAACSSAAEALVLESREAIRERGRFVFALSGGSTPRRLYEILATEHRADIEWPKVVIVFGDERCVPPDHEHSNYRMAKESLLSKVPLDKSNVLRVPCDDGSSIRAAADYNRAIRSLLAEALELDVVLLGMGTDGHTASLFSTREDHDATIEGGALEFDEERRVVVPRLVVPSTAPRSSPVAERVTFSYAAIQRARRVWALVTGADKAQILAEVMRGADLPIGRVMRDRKNDMVWFVDRAAGAEIAERRAQHP